MSQRSDLGRRVDEARKVRDEGRWQSGEGWAEGTDA